MLRLFGTTRRLLSTSATFRTVTRQDPYTHMETYGGLHKPLTLRFEYVDKSPDVMSLAERSKGPWTSLTMEEKHRLYRAFFPYSMADIQADGGKTMYVIIGTSLIVIVGISVFFVIQKYISTFKKPRKSQDPEWVAAALEVNKENLANPVFGMSSKRFK